MFHTGSQEPSEHKPVGDALLAVDATDIQHNAGKNAETPGSPNLPIEIPPNHFIGSLIDKETAYLADDPKERFAKWMGLLSFFNRSYAGNKPPYDEMREEYARRDETDRIACLDFIRTYGCEHQVFASNQNMGDGVYAPNIPYDVPNELKEDMQLFQYARAIQAWRAVEAIRDRNDRGPFITYLKGRLADIEYVEKARGSVIDEVRRILGEEDGQMVITSIYSNNASGDNTDLKMRGMSDKELGDHLLQELMRVNVERSENKYFFGSSWLENLLVIRQRMMEFKVQVENLLKRYGGLENAVEEEVFL